LAALPNAEEEVPAVTTGVVQPELRVIAPVTKEGGGQLLLVLSEGWGHRSQHGVVMPGTGKVVEREYTQEERQSISGGAEALGLSVDEAFARLGESTLDVYLNEAVYWGNVPKGVWDFVIGGYRVIKSGSPTESKGFLAAR
jgi:hypothetical protein